MTSETASSTVGGLLQSGQLTEALAMETETDGCPSDSLLQEVALRAVGGRRASSDAKATAAAAASRGSSPVGRPADVPREKAALSWQCVMRIRDKQTAAGLVSRLMLNWELQ
eukprot:scaffold312105_cov42-Prasinocladus_malaysianus.AAC.1